MRSSSEDKLSVLEQQLSEVRIHLSARGCAAASPLMCLRAAQLEQSGTPSRALALSNRPAFRSVGPSEIEVSIFLRIACGFPRTYIHVFM